MSVQPGATMKTQDPIRIPPRKPRRVPLDFAGSSAAIYAGPYLSYRRHRSRPLLIKMAEEIEAPCDLSVPTVDFGTPDPGLFKSALRKAADSLISGRPIFVGCRYGQGRTGLFLAALVKLHYEIEYRTGVRDWRSQVDPVIAVRNLYYTRAVETLDQERFVRELGLRWMSMWFAFWISPRAIFNKRFWVQST